MDRLFTYGSLQPGGTNEHLLSGVHGDWSPASVVGRLLDEGWGADIGYPGLELDEDGEPVDGWVLASPDLAQHWDRLDAFEGRHYQRVTTEVALPDGTMVPASVYVVRAVV